MPDSVSLADIEAAAARIAGHVRRTPVLADGTLRLKLENLQVSGSFKARGATNKVLTLSEAQRRRGLVTASGGNHGLGVAAAAQTVGVPATLYLPESTPAAKVAKLKKWGATVVIEGAVWDDANVAALAAAERDGLTYVHPFADPVVVAAQGTIVLEMAADGPLPDRLVVAIGGGGLIAGVATAAKALRPDIEIIGVEPFGAPTLHDSRKAGRLITLDRIATRAGSLAPRRSEQLNLDIVNRHVDDIVLVDDDEMLAAARELWFRYGLAVELSAAAGYAAWAANRIDAGPGETIGLIICGAGDDGISQT